MAPSESARTTCDSSAGVFRWRATADGALLAYCIGGYATTSHEGWGNEPPARKTSKNQGCNHLQRESVQL